MGDNNDEVILTDVVVARPTVAEQNELIAQLMQQIADMRVEMQRRQDTPPPGFGPNFVDARPPMYFPSSNLDPTQNQPSTPVHNPSGIDLTTQNPQYASEREWKAREEEKIDIKEEIKRAMKELQCVLDVAGLSYAELYIHLDLNLPEGFKILKFDTFGGVGNPMAHLRAYCDQLVGVSKDEALLMRLFSRSLCGEALEWFTSHETRQWPSWSALAKDFIDRFAYNVEIVPDRYSLEKMKQKSTESYREFAYRWRKEAARVRPPMTEKEIVEVFVRVQEPEYYGRIILLIGAKFVEIVKVDETNVDGLKLGKIARVSASPGSSGLVRKKREEVAVVSYRGRKVPRNSSRPQDRSKPPPKSHQAYRPQSNHSGNCNAAPTYPDAQILSYQNPPPNLQNFPSVFEKRPSRNFTALAESRTKLFKRLSAAGYIHPVGPKPVDVNSKFYKLEQRCAYHSNSPAEPNVNTNPLPNRGGGNINMIETDEHECETKRITPVTEEDLEKVVSSLSVKEKGEFVIMTPAKDVALVPSQTLSKPKFVIETVVAQGMTRSGRCYTPDELALGGQNKDHAKRPIS
ncbi:uncharacterized protein [Solanum lycopersicum]|uniref:uncharacterized protein n=1 Tax=Solanum lycopersicum TaxID=4081 RepID=UPI0002BC7E4A|nr:uncharacterized protein LOC101266339 [Solanum lycopersicum]